MLLLVFSCADFIAHVFKIRLAEKISADALVPKADKNVHLWDTNPAFSALTGTKLSPKWTETCPLETNDFWRSYLTGFRRLDFVRDFCLDLFRLFLLIVTASPSRNLGIK